MSRARHHTGSKKANESKNRAGGGEVREGNPHVYAMLDKHSVGSVHGSHGKKRLDRKCGGKASGGANSLHRGLHGAEKGHNAGRRV